MNFVQFNDVNELILDENLLENINFSINSGDKIGLIGLNGVGKSTIVDIILGKRTPHLGKVFVNNNVIIGHLSQNPDFFDDQNTVISELYSCFSYEIELLDKIQNIHENTDELDKLNNEILALDGYNIDTKINKVVNGLELEQLKEKFIKDLSGGQKTRVSLAKLLLKSPDLLILDEPTNHLDLASIEWLEDFLVKYNKTILLISHDRVFLDNVCNKIWEIENKKLYKYNGNFSDFVIQKELIIKGEIKAFEKEQEKIKKIKEYIERNRAGRMSKQARGRQTLLDRITPKENPVFNPQNMKLNFNFKTNTSDIVLTAENISKSYNKKIFDNISFNVYKGDKIGIIGKNGCGKSTLLKILNNLENVDNGNLRIFDRTNIAYFDQKLDNFNNENTILEEINTSLHYTNQELRQKASSFLFSDKDVEKKIKVLSGGEKVRVSLLKMTQKDANFLLLDEPTNHLDIYSIEVLENALIKYEGSFILVSHNRHFLDSVCNIIYVLDEKGLTTFKGSYNDYKNSIKENKANTKNQTAKISYLEEKEKIKAENKLKKDIQNIEKLIEDINLKKEQLTQKIYSPEYSSNHSKLIEFQEQIDMLSQEELELMEKWEELSYKLE